MGKVLCWLLACKKPKKETGEPFSGGMKKVRDELMDTNGHSKSTRKQTQFNSFGLIPNKPHYFLLKTTEAVKKTRPKSGLLMKSLGQSIYLATRCNKAGKCRTATIPACYALRFNYLPTKNIRAMCVNQVGAFFFALTEHKTCFSNLSLPWTI